MSTFFILLFIGVIVVIAVNLMSSKHQVTDDSFEQAGVKVIFSTGKITIKGRTYDVNDVQGIEHRRISSIGTEVTIKVDDFKKPLYKIGISGFGNAGEKFVQRLETALRKAGGPDFY